ncbi:MAG: tyrosine-type recombinase/integrase [Arcobacteraceae bacterium]|nr:tyrosine-type recombinase/integrase [Arcobacteraceae bacterium]
MALLSATQVLNAKPKDKDYVLRDGNGLQLLVKSNGIKLWEYRYTFNGTRKKTTFGKYDKAINTLSIAREKSLEFKKLLSQGINLVESRANEKKANKNNEYIQQFTISKVVNDYLEIKQHNKKLKDITITKALGRLNKHFYPFLPKQEKTNILDIDFDLIVSILSNIQTQGTLETLDRLKRLLIAVFKYAYTENIIKTTDIFGKLELKEFMRNLKEDVRNNPTITKADDIKRLLENTYNYPYSPLTKYAMLLSIHTAQRQGSIISAEWNEFNLDEKLWVIPASKMKMKKEHILPLSSQVIEILQELKQLNNDFYQSEYLFPNTQFGKHMSNNTVNQAIRRMGFSNTELTAHGLRAMFSTICNEYQKDHNFSSEIIERALAHEDKDKIRAIYNRATYIDELRKLMQWWSDYLTNI